MNIVYIVITVGSVTEVSKVDIAGERNGGFYIFGILKIFPVSSEKCVNVFIYESEDLLDRICLI
jgi:hypothetical protein